MASKQIPHNVTLTRLELLNIVKKHKGKYKMYELDQIVYEMGHERVRPSPVPLPIQSNQTYLGIGEK